MIVVADTTPLIGLAKAGRFYLLKEIFGKICIPKSIGHKLRSAGICQVEQPER